MAKLSKKEKDLIGFSVMKTITDTTDLIRIARGSEKRRLKSRKKKLLDLFPKLG